MRIFSFLCCLLLAAACSTPTVATPPATETTAADALPTYAGDWEVTVMDTPAGTVKGAMTLTEEAEGLDGTFEVGGNDVDLKSVERTSDGLLITFYSSEYNMDIDLRLKGSPADEQLTGTALGTYMAVATRKM